MSRKKSRHDKNRKIATFKHQRQCVSPRNSSTLRRKQKKVLLQQHYLNPFVASDDVLLVGEGDFSFAEALFSHATSTPHSLVATSYDTHSVVLDKYPHAQEHIAKLSECKVLHDVDATKLHSYRQLRHAEYTKIAFLFPHVGGLTKDQDRQIRANQLMLKGFFESLRRSRGLIQRGGKVIVTLFEGLPYSLWDLKGIAKTAGFSTERSGLWDWDQWQGYKHMRSLGNIDGKGGAWVGNKREARCYIFGFTGEENAQPLITNYKGGK